MSDTVHKNIQEVNNIYEDQVKLVRLRLNKGWDYVWFTYHEAKGMIMITSSYGNWSYIWSAMGDGVTLSQFFQRASADYLSDKLIDREDKVKFDSDNAFRDLKAEVIQERKDKILTATEARELLTAIQDMSEDFDSNYESDRSRFFDAFYDNEILRGWKEEYWEAGWGLRPSTKYNTLKNDIIPLIKNYFSGELKETANETQKS